MLIVEAFCGTGPVTVPGPAVGPRALAPTPNPHLSIDPPDLRGKFVDLCRHRKAFGIRVSGPPCSTVLKRLCPSAPFLHPQGGKDDHLGPWHAQRRRGQLLWREALHAWHTTQALRPFHFVCFFLR